MLLQNSRHLRFTRRPGRVSLVLILSLPTMALVLALGLNAGTLTEARTFLRTAADASALAAGQALVDDHALLGEPELMGAVLNDACAAAHAYVEKNPVPGGAPVRLRSNPRNDRDGDIVFGSFVAGNGKDFLVQPLDAHGADDFLFAIDTVRVTTRRTKERGTQAHLLLTPGLALTSADITTSATAFLDKWVYGFRPTDRHPIPLAPIALFADSSGQDCRSWQHQVEQRRGSDRFAFVKQQDGRFLAKEQDSDGLFEMKVNFRDSANCPDANNRPRECTGNESNACWLHIGIRNAAELAEQIVAGVSKKQLEGYGGEFLLPAVNERGVPGSLCSPTEAADARRLQLALQELQSLGEPRVWPLFSSCHPETGMPVLTGFVAARVASVTGPTTEGVALSFILQPCKMSTSTAVTDPSRQGLAGGSFGNPYICRVRLVE